LAFHASGPGSWGKLNGAARIERLADTPALLTEAEAREQQALFEKYLRLAESSGNSEKGRALFASSCQICHTVSGQGAQIGPVLDGAAASGLESMLRAILTPNAAMEGGYRTFRIDLADGETVEGFLVAQDEAAFVVRQPNAEDQRIPAGQVRRAEHARRSLMPEGLLQGLSDDDVRDLFAYLKTLK
jgi:putative heme-binding domain-containing protein